jgi:hypothetical protein
VTVTPCFQVGAVMRKVVYSTLVLYSATYHGCNVSNGDIVSGLHVACHAGRQGCCCSPGCLHEWRRWGAPLLVGRTSMGVKLVWASATWLLVSCEQCIVRHVHCAPCALCAMCIVCHMHFVPCAFCAMCIVCHVQCAVCQTAPSVC